MQLSLAPDDIRLAIPRQSRALRAFMLALLMHGLLFIFFYFGLHWQTSTPPAVDAELWSALPQFEAPKPEVAQPEVQEKPLEKSVEKPVPPQKITETPKPEIKPDIALEREKKFKEKRLQEERQQRELAAKKEAEAKKGKEQQRKDEALKQALRAADEKRLGIGKNPTANGTAAQTSGPSGEWTSAVAAAIRANINYDVSVDLQSNPEAVFLIKLLPSGEMIGAPQLLQSSGIKPYDEAVERAIRKTDPLPRPKNGIIERELKLKFRPRDKP